MSISHQSDTSSDGALLMVTDERGGGTSQTSCNTAPNGIIGGMHFWALRPIDGVPASAGAAPATPKRIGGWFYPNPGLLVDPLNPLLAGLGRPERACTIHVFRAGGNGTAGPGRGQAGFDGVSTLPIASSSRRTTARASGTSTSRRRRARATESRRIA